MFRHGDAGQLISAKVDNTKIREFGTSMKTITTCLTPPPPTMVGPSVKESVIALGQRGCPAPLLRHLCRGHSDVIGAAHWQAFLYGQLYFKRNPFNSRIMANDFLKCKGVPWIAKPHKEVASAQGKVKAVGAVVLKALRKREIECFHPLT